MRGALWLAFAHPVIALVAVAVASLSMIAIIVLLLKFLRGLVARMRRGGRYGTQAA